MWELISGTVLYFLALVGFGFIAALICMFIRDGWHERKQKRAFGKAELRAEAIKEAKLELLQEIHIYCEQVLVAQGKIGTNSSTYCMGIQDGVDYIEKYVDERYSLIKEDKE